MKTSPKSKHQTYQQDLMFSLEELPVQHSVLQGFAKGLEKIEETSHLSLLNLLNECNPHGLYGKMCPVSCQVMEDKTLAPSSEHWGNSGMGSLTGFLTLNMSEHNDFQTPSHKEEGVSSLSDILEETGEVLPRYYLTQHQCEKMLLRAEESEKKIPKSLHIVLQEATNSLKTK